MSRLLLLQHLPAPSHRISMVLGLSVMLFTMMFAIGCASSSGMNSNTSMAADDVERVLRSEAHRWDGTPHRMGGTTQRGVDCSGLVQVVYSDVFDLPLPRTTAEQVHSGNKVSRKRLAPGDLVFFRLSNKTRHVGIYLSNGQFAHASSSRGVTISHLDQPYWQDRYWTARRVLDTRTTLPAVAEREQPPARPRPIPTPRSEKSGRSGW